MSADASGPVSVAIVGAGLSGLAAACELSSRARVTVIDRVPAAGGVLGFEDPLVRALQREASSQKVDMALGTTALRWSGDRLLLAGPDGIRWLSAEHLVYAGGTRPATLAEEGAAGYRLAGVLAAPVAVHLLEAEVLLGHRVLVFGDGHWARVVLEELAHTPSEVVVACPDMTSAEAGLRSVGADQMIFGWQLRSVSGRGRISEAILGRGERRMRIACDALVLAGGERPLRNVDGAVFDRASAVTYVQPHGRLLDAEGVIERARRAAAHIDSHNHGAPAPERVA